MTSRLPRPCYVCGTTSECRVHVPDGRTVEAVLREHCGSMTLEAVADCYGMTRERIRQIEARALSKCAAIAHRLKFDWHIGRANEGSALARLASAAMRMRAQDAEHARRSRDGARERRGRDEG